MKILLPLAAVALLAVPAFAGPKVRPTTHAKKANLPTPATSREKLAKVAKAAVGDDILCVCQEGIGDKALGKLVVSVPPLATAAVQARCNVVPKYHKDGGIAGSNACEHFEVIGKLQPGDEFP
jgi:hypothetical protein